MCLHLDCLASQLVNVRVDSLPYTAISTGTLLSLKNHSLHRHIAPHPLMSARRFGNLPCSRLQRQTRSPNVMKTGPDHIPKVAQPRRPTFSTWCSADTTAPGPIEGQLPFKNGEKGRVGCRVSAPLQSTVASQLTRSFNSMRYRAAMVRHLRGFHQS